MTRFLWKQTHLALMWLATIAVLPAQPVENRAANTRENLEFFESRIRPLISDKCWSCHGEEKQKSGLRLDSLQGVLSGGENGPAAVPGDPDSSHMLMAIRYQNEDLQMPPKKPLSSAQVADIEKWISLGLPWPSEAGGDVKAAKRSGVVTDEDRRHWSFQPIKRTTPPGSGHPIDAFLRQKLDAAGLSAAPATDKRTLI